MIKKIITFFIGITTLIITQGQDYHAIQGSSYAGGLGVHNNPASIVNVPTKWDITILGAQVKNATNAVTLYNFSYLNFMDTAEYLFNSGRYNRFLVLNDNINLLNTRIALNKKSSIAFGANIKSYVRAKTSDYYFIDTMQRAFDFFQLNDPSQSYTADVAHSAWIELYATYARTVFDNESSRLNAGITLKAMRGISGAYGRLTSGKFSATSNGDFSITGGAMQYGYSANYDRWNEDNNTSDNLNALVRNSTGRLAMDIGFEYLVKPLHTVDIYDEDDYFDYDWKIGVSLLDVGANSFKHGRESRLFAGIKNGITSQSIESKFDSTITSVKNFNDSMATIVSQANALRGQFSVVNPTRLVINIDRFIYKEFSVNAELSLNVPGSLLKNYIYVQQLNLLTITPRWERKNLGFYMPIQYNNHQQLWIGAAMRAGPVLLGFHNLGNIFSKSKVQNGGGYIAFTIRASGKTEKDSRGKRLNCPWP